MLHKYWFKDAILKSLRESVNKLYFVNKQAELFQNHHFCIKNQKMAILVVYNAGNTNLLAGGKITVPSTSCQTGF